MPHNISDFEGLYKRLFPQALRLALSWLHDEEEARDLTQEVFLKLWKSETEVLNPEAFVVRSIRNGAINRLGAMGVREKFRRECQLSTPTFHEPDFESTTDDEVKRAVDRMLSPREREVVKLVYLGNMTYKEAAESLGVSVALINKCLVSSMKTLRNHFKTKGL